MVPSLLYVSHRVAPSSIVDPVVLDMVARARDRNQALDVTGALIVTRQHFAQYLEGPEEALTELMTSIGKDPLHSGLAMFSPRHVQTRRFWEWSLAMSRASAFVAKKIRVLADRTSAPQTDFDPLLCLMRVLVDEQTILASREVDDSIWPSVRSPLAEEIVNHEARKVGPGAVSAGALPNGDTFVDEGNTDLEDAVLLMRQALERLDASGASIAAAHLDLAISSATSVIDSGRDQRSTK